MLDNKIRRPHSALLGSPIAWPSWDASSVVLPLCCILSLHHYSVVASSLNQPSCDVKTPARGHKVGKHHAEGETVRRTLHTVKTKNGNNGTKTLGKKDTSKNITKTGVAVGTHAYRRTTKPDSCEGLSAVCINHQSAISRRNKQHQEPPEDFFERYNCFPVQRKCPESVSHHLI